VIENKIIAVKKNEDQRGIDTSKLINIKAVIAI
jgi:hypothetical protein